MIANQFISLIIPCKNEARALESVLENLPKVIDEVIVVDNNSSDKTRKTARNFNAIVLSEKRTDKNGIGYGYAISKGLHEAKGNIIICLDGDGSYPVKEIPQIINYLIKKKLDFISCNRLPFKNPKKMSSIRAFGVKILNFSIWTLYGYKIKDSLSGMWVFKRYAFDNISLNEGGWNLSLEIKLKAILNSNVKFSEYHIPYQDRVLDLSKQNLIRTGLEHAVYLLRFKANIFLRNLFKTASSYA